jgi:hypothetical protein
MRFRGTTCDQCKTDGKHPGHGQPDGPLTGWHRITNDCGTSFDFCSIKCAIDWLKERKRQQAERARQRRGAPGLQTLQGGSITGVEAMGALWGKQ